MALGLMYSRPWNHIAVAEQEVLKGEKPDGQIHLQTHRGEKVREHSSWTDYRARTAEQGTEGAIQGRTGTSPFDPRVPNTPAQRTTAGPVKRHKDRTKPLKRENSTDSPPGQTSPSGRAPRAPPRAEHVPGAVRAPALGSSPDSLLAGPGHLRQPPTPPAAANTNTSGSRQHLRPPRAGPFLQAPGTSHPGRDGNGGGCPREGRKEGGAGPAAAPAALPRGEEEEEGKHRCCPAGHGVGAGVVPRAGGRDSDKGLSRESAFRAAPRPREPPAGGEGAARAAHRPRLPL
ncbi:translation initiation factor IF-2-like [Pipra filicauda]|uniref:Translation initiation factor IF-2-like n=1 Tax=Pipra filicauda TaxID=649802 RepID=A0A7R5KR66_9PASS|nr:translation initiation factor IF-2-like [Pipra filicauda]